MGYDTWIWHGGAPSPTEKRILDRYYRKRWVPVIGGTTVGTRAIGAAIMAGIRRIDVYGLDSCLLDGEHHAYSQPENDETIVCRVRVGRKIFRCHPWMIVQADEFLQMAGLIPDSVRLGVHGS